VVGTVDVLPPGVELGVLVPAVDVATGRVVPVGVDGPGDEVVVLIDGVDPDGPGLGAPPLAVTG
jgi:hypothetical protein